MQITLETVRLLAESGMHNAQECYRFLLARPDLPIFWELTGIGSGVITWDPPAKPQRQVLDCNGNCEPECNLCQRLHIRVMPELDEDELAFLER